MARDRNTSFNRLHCLGRARGYAYACVLNIRDSERHMAAAHYCGIYRAHARYTFMGAESTRSNYEYMTPRNPGAFILHHSAHGPQVVLYKYRPTDVHLGSTWVVGKAVQYSSTVQYSSVEMSCTRRLLAC